VSAPVRCRRCREIPPAGCKGAQHGNAHCYLNNQVGVVEVDLTVRQMEVVRGLLAQSLLRMGDRLSVAEDDAAVKWYGDRMVEFQELVGLFDRHDPRRADTSEDPGDA
jgi:hypothetical protein